MSSLTRPYPTQEAPQFAELSQVTAEFAKTQEIHHHPLPSLARDDVWSFGRFGSTSSQQDQHNYGAQWSYSPTQPTMDQNNTCQICRHTTSKLQADLQEACSIITQLKIENQGLTERMQVAEGQSLQLTTMVRILQDQLQGQIASQAVMQAPPDSAGRPSDDEEKMHEAQCAELAQQMRLLEADKTVAVEKEEFELAQEIKKKVEECKQQMAAMMQERSRHQAAMEEQARRRAAVEEQARQRAMMEAQARQHAADEQARQRAADEQARQRAADEQARQRAADEQARQRAGEEQARQRAAIEEQASQTAAAQKSTRTCARFELDMTPGSFAKCKCGLSRAQHTATARTTAGAADVGSPHSPSLGPSDMTSSPDTFPPLEPVTNQSPELLPANFPPLITAASASRRLPASPAGPQPTSPIQIAVAGSSRKQQQQRAEATLIVENQVRPPNEEVREGIISNAAANDLAMRRIAREQDLEEQKRQAKLKEARLEEEARLGNERQLQRIKDDKAKQDQAENRTALRKAKRDARKLRMEERGALMRLNKDQNHAKEKLEEVKIEKSFKKALQVAAEQYAPSRPNSAPGKVAAGKGKGKALEVVTIRSEKEALIAVGKDGMRLATVSNDLCNNGDVVLAAVLENGMALQFASDALRADEEVVFMAVQQNVQALQFASKELRNNQMLQAMCGKQRGLQDAVDTKQRKSTNRGALMSAILDLAESELIALMQEDGLALAGATADMRDNDDVVLAAVQQNGMALQFASDELRADEEVVFVAVTQNGQALQFASDHLHSNEVLVSSAIQQDGMALEHASIELISNQSFVCGAVEQNGLALQHAHPALQGDRDLVLCACEQNGMALEFAQPRIRADKQLVCFVVSNCPAALEFASEELLSDVDVLQAAFQDSAVGTSASM